VSALSAASKNQLNLPSEAEKKETTSGRSGRIVSTSSLLQPSEEIDLVRMSDGIEMSD
jgi:hemin uptake protein HemP